MQFTIIFLFLLFFTTFDKCLCNTNINIKHDEVYLPQPEMCSLQRCAPNQIDRGDRNVCEFHGICSDRKAVHPLD